MNENREDREMNDGNRSSYALADYRSIKKTRHISPAVLILAVFLAIVITFQITALWLSGLYREEYADMASDLKQYKALAELADIFDENYIYDVDEEEIEDALLHSYAIYSGDDYAYYYNAEEWAENVEESGGSSYGIGTYIDEADNGILLTFVMDNSPAKEAGLQDGDVIIAVDGKAVSALGYDDAVSAIRGDAGTSVSLTVLRESEKLDFTVTRNEYETQSVIARIIEDNGVKIGYIDITRFYANTPEQFENAVNALIENGCRGLLFDVRSNPGGELNSICEILDFLLPKGPIVNLYTKNSDGEMELSETVSSDASCIDMPMAVLTNGGTASAAELFTSALRDYEKVVVVGEQTYGKGCGQSGHALSTGGVVMITTFLYTPPYSGNYDKVGITPDIVVSLPEEASQKNILALSYTEDTQLQAAVNALYAKIN